MPLIAAWLGASWPLELASHFVALGALAVGLIVASCALRGRWSEVAVGTALSLIYAALWAPLYLPRSAPPARGDARFKVLAANLLYVAEDLGSASAWILSKDPDVLVLQELTPRWRAALEPVLARYADHRETLREDAFGIGVYSKSSTLEPLDAAHDGPPMIAARLEHHGRPLTLFAVHTIPPIRGDAAARRDRQLMRVADLARRTPGNVIMAGDLNTTSWSPVFRTLLDASGLVDTRRGFGLQGTWYSTWPAPLRIPIDHVLTSRDIVTKRREVGPDVGSDHRPIFAELALR